MSGLMSLCRLSNLPTIWMNVLAALILSRAEWTWSGMLLLMLSMSFFYSGGMCLNDVVDADLDALKNPQRPIPSGRMGIRTALAFSLGFLAFGLLLLSLFGMSAFLGGILLLAAILLYDLWHNIGKNSIFLMATCRILIYLICVFSLNEYPNTAILTICIFQFFYIFFLSALARKEKTAKNSNGSSLMPLLIAGISVLDGAVMAIWGSFLWIFAGLGTALLALNAQRWVKGT